MNTKPTLNKYQFKLLQYTLFSIILWTLIIIFLLKWNQKKLDEETFKRAFIYTKVGFDKDIIYRRWVSGHGGVYVPVTKETPSNPYLSHIKNRDIFVDSIQYTLVNPAYMSRQVYDLESATSKSSFGHITSLKPIRPENKADAWETKALHLFEKGTKEYYEIDSLNGKAYFRYMKPFVVENSCLKCHAHQGYKIGDIRGGISISYPIEEINILKTTEIRNNFFTHFIIWILGIGIIIIAYIRIKKSNNKQLEAEADLINLNYELEERIENRTLKLQQEIATRKKTEESLHKSEEKFRTLSRAVEQSPASIIITDLNGIIEYVNPKFCAISGYNLDEVIGKKPSILKSGNTVPQEYENLWNTILNGKEWSGEFLNKRKDGSTYWEQAIITGIKDTDSKVTHFLAVKEDISQRKKFESELIAAKEKAEESDRLKSAFLANMSHEIRTPMSGILGFSELLKTPQLSPEKQQKYIDIIEKSGKRMLNTINDIMDISKIEAGLMTVTLSKFNIKEQLDDIYNFFKIEAEHKGLILLNNNGIKPENEVIITDKEKLYSIMTNLIKNAIKFTHKGTIEFGFNIKDEKLEFCVKDTGIGIPKNRQTFIFDRFIQADIEDKLVHQGSGLGLTISKSYVEMLGGEIWVTSDEGKGSQFNFTIPYKSGN